MDYMWEEMKAVVLSKRMPVYAHFLQRLFAAKVPQVLLNNYPRISPTLHRLPTTEELIAKLEEAPKPRSKRARCSSTTSETRAAPMMTHKYRGSQQSSREVKPNLLIQHKGSQRIYVSLNR